eukprot:3042206-Pyramimonas_sp.AAC.1
MPSFSKHERPQMVRAPPRGAPSLHPPTGTLAAPPPGCLRRAPPGRQSMCQGVACRRAVVRAACSCRVCRMVQLVWLALNGKSPTCTTPAV